MLIKDRDSKEGAIEQLRELLSLDLSPKKKFLIERELKNLNPDTLAEFAGNLASLNQPNQINYQRLFFPDAVENTQKMRSPNKIASIYCDYAI